MSARESRLLEILHHSAAPPAQPHRLLSVGAVVCGIVSLVLIAGDLGPEAFALGLLAAAVPVPVYVALALWLDRFEPEPPRTLFQTFAWGATVAVFVALMVNMLSTDVLEGMAGRRAAELFAGLITAPLVEELAKGFALLVLFRELKDEFDGVVDGVVYAAMVGLGFAMIENVEYYGEAFAQGNGRTHATFLLRGLLSPFAHPLFTSMFGIGLGWARERHGRGGSWAAPVLGLAAAIALHSLWNLAATFEGWFFVLYLLVMFPAFLGVLAVIWMSLRREGRVLRAHLAPLVRDGLLTEPELECLCRVRSRMNASMDALRRGGLARWRARREMHRIASELAFHRWRVMRGLSMGAAADAQREAEYLGRLSQLCDQIRE